MTVAAPCASTTSARPARVGGFDATWLLWIAIIAVLLFLVVSPFVYLVVTSFTAERTGDFTFANYVVAYGRARYVEALFNSLKLGAVSAGAGRRCSPFRSPGRCRAPTCRGAASSRMLVLATFITPPYTGAVAWILLAGPNAGWLNRFYMFADRRRGGAVQHLQLHRPRRRHRALFLSLHLHLHLGRARAGVVGDGGRRQHPGRGDVAHHAAGHPAAGAAGDPGRADHLLPRSHRAVRARPP